MLAEEIARLKSQLVKEKRRLAQLEMELGNIPQKEAEYVRLRRHSDLYEKFYLLMMDRKAQYGINKAGTIPEFRVLSAASASSVPVYPRKLVIYGGAMGSGILVSIVFVVLVYLISNTVTGQGEAEKLLMVPVLGSIPKYTKRRLDNSQLVIHENPKSQISEAFRSVRTNMEFIVPKKSGKIVTITSTLSGEGKTFTAVNLGGIIAMAGQKVVVLDLDMRKPKLHLGFSTLNEDGMSTLLIGRAKLKECIKHSIVEGLDFITAGPIPPNPAELMMSDQLDKLLKDLAKAYDVVVIDTPPIGIVADAVLLMRKADIPIYVLRADFSKRIFCKNINRIKTTFQLANLCVILNSTSKGAKYGYGNVVSYGYGYYDEEQRSAMRRLVSR
jgi:capsular exopolysaccharide synthesis family protein